MSGAQQGGDDKNSMALLWIVGFIFGVGVIVWLLFAPQLKYVFIKIRMLEMYLVTAVLDLLPDSIPTLHDIRATADKTLEVTKVMTPDQLTGTYAGQLSAVVGGYLRIPVTILLALFAYLMYGRNIKMRYRKKYTMDSLAKQEAVVWPQINPVIDQKIEEADIDHGIWAMAQPPIEFCKAYKLISISVEMPTNVLSKGPQFHMILDKQRTTRLFASQLGRLWQGPEALPIHRRALLAAIVARACRDTKAAQNLIKQINKSCVGGKLDKLDFSGADALWKKHINAREIQEIIHRHAYESTVFIGLLLFARQDGVFASADFLWLKPLDRKFWYLLNNVGRQTAFCEAAGVHAHYLAECALRRPLGVPMVQEATKALEIALQDMIYVPSAEEKEQLLKQVAETT
ncbi:MAG TPA: type IVB secretion system coupling complex protein DotM/IcmP [Gammaproteobacteria bacterium]|nr:type IVB secretion system coupling complex protein DotM/IcmP [Gammaproteobacteria bacterium]